MSTARAFSGLRYTTWVAPSIDLAGLVGVVEGVDRGEEPGEGLARAGGSADQRVPAGDDRRPAPGLGLGRSVGKPPLEPRPYRGMEPFEGPGGTVPGRPGPETVGVDGGELTDTSQTLAPPPNSPVTVSQPARSRGGWRLRGLSRARP